MTDENLQLIQQTELPNIVELFEIVFKGVEYRLTNSIRNGVIYWNNKDFSAFPLTISDVTFNETNANDTPKLALAKRDAYWLSAIYQLPPWNVEICVSNPTGSNCLSLISGPLHIFTTCAGGFLPFTTSDALPLQHPLVYLSLLLRLLR